MSVLCLGLAVKIRNYQRTVSVTVLEYSIVAQVLQAELMWKKTVLNATAHKSYWLSETS